MKQQAPVRLIQTRPDISGPDQCVKTEAIEYIAPPQQPHKWGTIFGTPFRSGIEMPMVSIVFLCRALQTPTTTFTGAQGLGHKETQKTDRNNNYRISFSLWFVLSQERSRAQQLTVNFRIFCWYLLQSSYPSKPSQPTKWGSSIFDFVEHFVSFSNQTHNFEPNI